MRRALVLILLLVSAARAGTVRYFAVGNKVRLDDAVTYRTFHDKMAALMDASFPGRAGLVQAGVDDVASHLRPADIAAPADALVVFPEDVGLVAAFIGTRGAAARAQSTTAGAIVSLLGPYAVPFGYYQAKYPDQPLVRLLVLALTDTLYRAFYETFRELAVAHHVHLAASANLAPARRIDAADDPSLVAMLGDPDEPSRGYAYAADSPFPHNTTFVFAPDGSVLVPDGHGGVLHAPAETDGLLRGSADKAYLVPIEQPPPGDSAGLALAFGAVRDLDVLPTPVGRLGIVISKDAWMVDVNDRLAAKGANVVLQPEAFSEWAYAAQPWQPDIFKEGGFATLQKLPELLVNVDASMTGNLLDVTFDGQSAILGRKRKAGPGPLDGSNAWIGQNPDTGFLAMAPWIEPDPGIAGPGLGLAARRAALAAAGVRLLPGSGIACAGSLIVGACENGYREAVVWADVTLPDGDTTAPVDPVRAAPPRFGAAVRASGDEVVAAEQHAPQIAVAGRRVYVVWHESRGGVPNVLLAVSKDGGDTFAPPIRVSDAPAWMVAESFPAVAVRGGNVWVVWQELASPGDDDHGRIRLARLGSKGQPRGPTVRVDDADSGKWQPAVALVGRTPVVAWIDERDHGPEGEPLEHVYAATGRAGGRSFTPSVRVDAGTPVPLAAHLDNKWGPTLAVAGRAVYAAWADFRAYNWDIVAARSDDEGASWGANVQVDDFADVERLDERPSLVADTSGRVHAVWTDLRAREPDTNIFYAASTDRGASFSANRQLDDSKSGFDPDRDTPTNQWHPSLAADGDRLFVAWQDDREGNDDIFFTSSADGGRTFARSERVDDTGNGTSTQARPRLAIGGRRARRTCYVAWEDDRNGNPDIYVAHRPCADQDLQSEVP